MQLTTAERGVSSGGTPCRMSNGEDHEATRKKRISAQRTLNGLIFIVFIVKWCCVIVILMVLEAFYALLQLAIGSLQNAVAIDNQSCSSLALSIVLTLSTSVIFNQSDL